MKLEARVLQRVSNRTRKHPGWPSGARQLFLNVLGNLGAGLVIALATALWERLRHQSVDWYGIAALFLLTSITFYLLLKKMPQEKKNDHGPAVRFMASEINPEKIANGTIRLVVIDSVGNKYPIQKVPVGRERRGEIGLVRVRPRGE